MWKIFLLTAYVKNLMKLRATANRTKIAFGVNRLLLNAKCGFFKVCEL